MRILKVCQYYYPAIAFGGPVFKVKAIAEELSARGHEVTIVTSNLLDLRRKLNSQTVVKDVNGVSVLYLGALLQYRAITVNPDILAFCRQSLQEFDVIHTYDYYDLLAPIVCYFARKWAIPYVVEPIGNLIPIVRSVIKKRIYQAILGRGLIAGASKVIATSEQEKDELISAGIDPAKIVQRRNGINLSEFAQLPQRGQFRQRMGIEESQQVVLYLSRICPKKSPDLLMRAFAELHQPETRLVIAGPDEGDGYLQQLKALRSQLGLDNRILFVGPLYGKEKLSAFMDADIFVLPSQNENFGNVIAEAVAAGTPVVITDRCGIAPYIRNRVGLVVAHDRGELRDAIACLLNDRALRDKFKANCRSVAQEFSWDEPVTQMETLYAELMKKGH